MSSQAIIDFGVQTTKTFNNFYVGSNTEVVHHLQNALQVQNGIHYLWGGHSCGKSHLLDATCSIVRKQGLQATLVPLKMKRQLSPEIFENLELSADLICLDDIQEIEMDPLWEVAVFNLFNRIKAEQKKLLMTADKPPHESKIVLPDLRSRYASCTVFHLHNLSDDDDKIAALQYVAKKRGFLLPDKTLRYIMNYLPREASYLFDLLDALDHASLSEHRKITVQFVKKFLADL